LDCRLLKYFISDPVSLPTGSALGAGVPFQFLVGNLTQESA